MSAYSEVLPARAQGELCHRQRGFTLVEVVVALTLLSLLLAATISAMRTLGNTRESVSAVTSRVDDMRMVSQFLRNALESAVPPQNTGLLRAGGGSSMDNDGLFEGTQHELIWKAPLMFGQDTGGSYELRLVREENKLMLYWRDSAVDRLVGKEPRPWSNAARRELVRNVQEFTVQYRPFGDEPWQSQWQDEGGNPRAVSLQIKVGERYWPQLVVSLPQ
ncbi:MAG: general secretion pathway protein GspJ [Gammaproteobacteria bacterium]|nr:MAG: general secretion pathway protein GspJ [Gammaproteobacteria bacterium]